MEGKFQTVSCSLSLSLTFEQCLPYSSYIRLEWWWWCNQRISSTGRASAPGEIAMFTSGLVTLGCLDVLEKSRCRVEKLNQEKVHLLASAVKSICFDCVHSIRNYLGIFEFWWCAGLLRHQTKDGSIIDLASYSIAISEWRTLLGFYSILHLPAFLLN